MKKILFVTYRLPNPLLKDGYSIRALGLAEILKKGHKVDLVSLYQNKKELEHKAELQKIFNNLYLFLRNIFFERMGAFKGVFTSSSIQTSIYFSPKMQGWINKNCKDYDIVFCETLRVVKYVENISSPVVVDLIESLSLKYFRAKNFVNPFWRLVYEIEMPRVLKEETKILKKFNKVFISSPFDKYFLEKKIGHSLNNLVVLPNGIKEEILQLPVTSYHLPIEEGYISFFGKMDYQPNEDAVLWFSKIIFSKIQQRIPGLKFYIVGTNPTRKIRNLQKNKDIKVTGFLENPYKILKKSKLIVVPLRFGAGIQNKVLETMALGKAIVLSPVAARGIKEGKDDKHFIIENPQNPEIFAQKVLSLLSRSKKREELGKNAKVLVQEKYRWEKIGRELLQEIKELLK